jgi:hypothetical protein
MTMASAAAALRIKGKAAWHFRPSEGTSLVQPTNPQMTLKRLGEEIELAIGVTGVQFREPPPLIKAAPKKRPTRHKKRSIASRQHRIGWHSKLSVGIV